MIRYLFVPFKNIIRSHLLDEFSINWLIFGYHSWIAFFISTLSVICNDTYNSETGFGFRCSKLW